MPTISDLIWILIGCAAFGLLLGVTTGFRIHDGERHVHLGPLIKIKNFWAWLSIVALSAAAVGAWAFLVLTDRVNPPVLS